MHVDADSTCANVLVELPISYQNTGQKVAARSRDALTLINEGGEGRRLSGTASAPFVAGASAFPIPKRSA
jgi:hypothetical protein